MTTVIVFLNAIKRSLAMQLDSQGLLEEREKCQRGKESEVGTERGQRGGRD